MSIKTSELRLIYLFNYTQTHGQCSVLQGYRTLTFTYNFKKEVTI